MLNANAKFHVSDKDGMEGIDEAEQDDRALIWFFYWLLIKIPVYIGYSRDTESTSPQLPSFTISRGLQ